MEDTTGIQHWFQSLKSYHDPGRSLGLLNSQIRDAAIFDGWNDDYLTWPKEHWKNYEKGEPSHDESKNAFHVQYLANQMRDSREWIGRRLEVVRSTNVVKEGNHRIRAVKFLYEEDAIVIPEPEIVWF